jgi:hypothetical protein
VAPLSPPTEPTRSRVGGTRAARDFFAGRYAKVAKETYDAPASVADVDVAFAVGALTFLGRVEDARACFEGWRRTSPNDPRTLAASRFFLGLAYARAGDFARSHDQLAADALRRVRVTDPWAAAFVYQGLACHRYFTGRYRAAARHALRALKSAHAAGLAYAKMLSTDLRGHALVQLGHYHAGTALLEQAKSHAERLGFDLNAHAIECSLAVYAAEFKIGPEAVGGLLGLLGRSAHDSYSRRQVQTQLAIQYALRGRGSEARASLGQADEDALRLDGRRAKVVSLLARLYVTRFSRGPRACAKLLDETAALTDRGDVAFRAELLAFQAYVGRALGDADRTARALDDLRHFTKSAEHHLAAAALEPYAPERAPAFAEDEVTPVLRAAAEHDARPISRWLALGVLGPIPEALGLEPGRRVIVLASENAVLIEDHGDLWARPSPPRWLSPLLRLLARGASKEQIVAELWGLRRYHPERHDSLVRTTIHRLRAFLDPRGDWVIVTPTGYGLDAAVHFAGAAPQSAILDVSLADDDPLDSMPAPARSPVPRSRARRTVDDLVLERVAAGAVSVPEIVEALAQSESTVLRALRRLVAAKKVVKRGAARATRYGVRRGR